MSWQPMVLVIVLLVGAAQKRALEGRNTADLSCGKPVQVAPVYSSGVRVGGQTGQTPTKNAKPGPCHRGQGSPCPKKRSLAAETTTGKDETSDFTGIEPGSYGLVGRRDGAHPMVAVNYDPDAHTGDKCSGLVYELKNGNLYSRK